MLFTNQHNLIIKIFKVREKWGAIAPLAPLFRHPCPHVLINRVTLQTTEQQIYLGLHFDTCLSWNSHVSYVCKKMSYYLYLIKTHCKVLKSDVMKLLIESLVFFHLTYAASVWGSSLKKHLVKCIERL